MICSRCNQDHHKEIDRWCDRSDLEIKYELLEKKIKDLVSAVKPIIQNSDRDHAYWIRAKELIKEIESMK